MIKLLKSIFGPCFINHKWSEWSDPYEVHIHIIGLNRNYKEYRLIHHQECIQCGKQIREFWPDGRLE